MKKSDLQEFVFQSITAQVFLEFKICRKKLVILKM